MKDPEIQVIAFDERKMILAYNNFKYYDLDYHNDEYQYLNTVIEQYIRQPECKVIEIRKFK